MINELEVEAAAQSFSELLNKENPETNVSKKHIKQLARLGLKKEQILWLIALPTKIFEIIIEGFTQIQSLTADTRKIYIAQNRILENINALLEFAHVDQDYISNVDIHKGIDSTLLLLESKLKNIQIQKYYSAKSLIKCHAGQLNQIWQNILINAAQAMAYKGSIVISTKENRHYVIISIKDSGIGIREDSINRIFEPYFSTKPQGEGMGLGLHICYKIVKQHNGKISVSSNKTQGTEFIVELPK
jgi:signal transduction histidine kinase